MAKATSEQKLKELIKYISAKCADDVNFGKTKLNKILFLCDFLYYKKHQKSISEHEYVRLPFGPVPNDFQRILTNMMGIDIGIAISQSGIYDQEKIFALKKPDLSIFESDMIAHVDSIIELVCGNKSLTATQLSEVTHKTMGWIVTPTSKKIPYQSIYVKNKKHQVATDWEKSKAKEIATLLAGQYGYPQAS